MKYCIHCGTQLEDDANFCINCGQNPNPAAPETVTNEAVFEQAETVAYETAQETEQTVYQQPVYQQTTAPAADRPSVKGPIIGLSLGIAGLCLAIVLGLYGPFGLIGIGVSIAGLVVSNKAKVTNPGSNMAAHGARLSLAGIIVGAILTIIFSIIWLSLGHFIINS